MRSSRLGPAWSVFLLAILGGALAGPRVQGSQRASAAVGVLLVLARGATPPPLAAVGLALGVLGGVRQDRPLRQASTYDAWEGTVRLEVAERVDARRHRVWLASPGRPRVQAVVSGLDPDVEKGQRGRARLRTWLPRPRRNPDDRDRLRAALATGVALRGSVESFAREGASPAPSLRECLRARARAWLGSRAGAGEALWRALLLGDRRDLSPRVMLRFQRLGLAHLLALSGLHVGLVAGMFVLVLRRWRGRDSWWPVVMVLGWSLLVGLTPSLMRAVGMVAWSVAGRRLRRGTGAVEGLPVIGLLEWIVAPERLLGLGWWLSYAATAGLLRAAPLLARLPRVGSLVALTVAAQLATLPWTLGAFGYVSPAAPLFHVVAGPAFALLMVAGVGTVAVAALCPPLGSACFALLQAASHAFGFLLLFLEKLAPSPWGHPGLGGSAWAAALGGVGLWLVPWARASLRGRLAATLGLLALAHAPLLARPAREWVSLDVGQGDAGVYRAGHSAWLVVDAGPGFENWNAGEAVVERYLARRNARGVTLLLTHGHRDHTGGAPPLLRSGRVDTLVLAASDSGRAWVHELLEVAEAHAVGVRWLRVGQVLMVGEERIPCLWPPAARSRLSTNNRSLVLAVGPSSAWLLLTGDLEAAAETHLPRTLEEGRVAVLKVAHHGGNTGTGRDFLRRIRAGTAIVSCGRANRYGHPDPRTLERLERAGLEVLRTDEVGAIRVRWRHGVVRVQSVSRPP